jgi:hypothetical protein
VRFETQFRDGFPDGLVAMSTAWVPFAKPGLDFENGKARRGWVFADVPSLMAQLGTQSEQETYVARQD